MAKHYFKLKFPLIQFCRPKHHSTLPAINRLSPVNAKALDTSFPNSLPAPPPSTPEHPSNRRRVSSKSKTTKSNSIGCGSCSSRSCTQYFADRNIEIKSSANYQRDDHSFMSPISETEMYYKKKRKEEKRKKKKAKAKAAELPFLKASSENYGNWFSGEFEGDDENDKESETPVYSSRSFSNEFSLVLESIAEKMSEKEIKSKKKTNNNDYSDSNVKKVRRMNSGLDSKKEGEWKSSGENGKVKAVLRPMRACRGEAGKVRESVAVVKKSEDPYEDFKRSMMEMIMEKQIFEAKELEELLLCFLTLNSRHYQGVIVEAFSEIWELLFSDPNWQS